MPQKVAQGRVGLHNSAGARGNDVRRNFSGHRASAKGNGQVVKVASGARACDVLRKWERKEMEGDRMKARTRGELVSVGKNGNLTEAVLKFLPRFAEKHYAMPAAILVKQPGGVTAIGNIPVMQDGSVTPYCAFLALDK